jgi:hypothetical protein
VITPFASSRLSSGERVAGSRLRRRASSLTKYFGWHLFGPPAQLGEGNDPHMLLKREREANVEAARMARMARMARLARGPKKDG